MEFKMAGLNNRLERIKALLICPACGFSLDLGEAQARCLGCQKTYPIRNGKIFFSDVPQRDDDLDRLKNWLKKSLGKYYYTIGRDLLAPTFPFNQLTYLRRFLDPRSHIVVDAGCGNHRLHPDIICMDIFDHDVVDIVCDLKALPFQSGCIDAIVTRSVLEHVPEPAVVVADFHRITKVGGYGIHLIPFMYPFHASPNDFNRYTHMGQRLLFRDWTVIAQTNPTGPVSLILLSSIEMASIVLSFGNTRARSVLYLLFCGLLFPLKYLDVLFVNRKAFLSMAPSILSLVRKDHRP
jgi:SAM-dependent methyltransferase